MDEIQNFIIPTADLSIVLCKPQVQESDIFCKINVRPSASIMNKKKEGPLGKVVSL